MRSILKNKRAQIDNPLIAFAIIVIALIIFAPIALKIFLNVHTSMGNSLGNVTGGGGDLARQNLQKVTGTLVTFWDKVIVAAFFLAIILLFVSAFLVDAHPFFIVLYIFLNFMLILFAPSVLQSVDTIYDSAAFATEITYLTFLDSLRNNFVPFLVGMMVIAGIITYGKLAFFRGRSNNRK